MIEIIKADTIKTYWPILFSLATILVSLVSVWATFGTRLTNVEERQNRQGTTLAALQDQVAGLANDISGIKSDIGSIKDNVNYIRNRIDRVTQ